MAEEYDYPEDEFDRLAKERKVLGAHREVESKRKWWLAVLAIIVIVPLLAWIFVRAGAVDSVTQKQAEPTPSATATETQSETPTPEPSDTESSSDESEDTTGTDEDEDTTTDDTTTDDAEVDTSIEVRVLNGSQVNGFAATKESQLKEAGFTNTVADNYGGGSTPTRSTVFYANEADEATAEKVASTLGISEVVLSPQSVSGGEGIVAVLRSDIA
ncbi:MAG: LytR C-terminal domain-containing protein [Actinomycetaceae bacterium]|nr:LytR C-terminal domain-containing protein [Actinomycetaceae bacterium]